MRVIVAVALAFVLHAVVPDATGSAQFLGSIGPQARVIAPQSVRFGAERDSAAAPGEAGVDRNVPTQTIRKLQSLFREMAYYDGPPDGILSPSLAKVIRDYLRQAGRSVPDKLTKEVLDQLELALERDLLERRLDEEVRRRKAAARWALLGQPETRDLVAHKDARPSDRIVDPTRDPTPCFRAPTSACLLREATESAKAENRAELRDWAYGAIVAVQAQARLLTEAFETARLIEDPRKIVIALRHIAEAQSANGDIASALRTASLVPNSYQRAEALKAILEQQDFADNSQAKQSVFDKLGAAAAGLSVPSQRVSVLAALAVGYWHHGSHALANATLGEARRIVGETVVDPTARRFGLSTIAEALAEMGRPTEALQLLDGVKDQRDHDSALVKVTEALALHGDTWLALAAAQAIEAARYRAVALANIARAEASRGELRKAQTVLKQALQTLPEIEVTYTRAFAASRISVAAAAVLGLEDAIGIAQEIEQDRLRAMSLWEIVVDRAAVDDEPGMRMARASALAATEEIGSVTDQALVHAEAAIALIQAGRREDARRNFERALGFASSITNPWSRAQVLTEVARALVALFP